MTLHELLKQVADIVLPNSGLYEYMLHTFDDNGGFLRTRYCWWNKPVNDYEKIKDIKLVLLTARSEIKPEQLTDKENTRVKLQLTYSEDFNGDTEWERQLGYCYCYIVDLENKSYTMRIEEPLY